MTSTTEWERACKVSLRRSRKRRENPSPWPRGGEWATTLVLLGLFAVGVAIYILLWVVQS